MTVKERLIKYLKYNKISQAAFADSINVSSGYVNAIRVSIQPDKIDSIAGKYPDLNTGWLLTGEGDMLRKQDLVANIQNVTVAPFVSQYSSLDFSKRFADQDYINSLPRLAFTLSSKYYHLHKFISFEVPDDSMLSDDEGWLDLYPEDIVLCYQIGLAAAIQVRGQSRFFVIVTRNGLAIRYFHTVSRTKRTVKLQSANNLYEDITLGFDEILDVYMPIQLIRNRLHYI